MHAPFKTHEGQKFLQERHSFNRHVITIQVMAVSDVSPADHHPVGAILEGS